MKTIKITGKLDKNTTNSVVLTSFEINQELQGKIQELRKKDHLFLSFEVPSELTEEERGILNECNIHG